jgi:hypothetical protein
MSFHGELARPHRRGRPPPFALHRAAQSGIDSVRLSRCNLCAEPDCAPPPRQVVLDLMDPVGTTLQAVGDPTAGTVIDDLDRRGPLCIPLHDARVDGYSAAEYAAHVKLGRRALA